MFANAQELARRVTDDFISGRIGSLTLDLAEAGQHDDAAPGSAADPADRRRTRTPARTQSGGSVEFEPSPEFVLGRLLPKYLEFTLYSAMLETNASFYAAQLVAMNNATDNAKKLIDENTVEMNKARQAAITKEILEIVGGAEALKG